jgi:hypothetical protein
MAKNAAGEVTNIEKDTVDIHNDGIWAGWIRHADINGKVTMAPIYMTVNKKSKEIYFGNKKGERNIIH